MQVQMRGKRVGIEKLGKSQKANSFLEMPEDTNSQGVIKYLGAEAREDLKVGDKVYFGNQRITMNIEGKEIYVMDDDNVVAIVQE